MLFGICYQFCTFKNPIFSTHFSLESEITGLTALSLFGFYFFSTRSPSPGDLPNLGIEPRSPALQADTLPSEPPGKLISSRVRLKPRSAFLTLVPTIKNFRSWQAGGQMILIWLIFWLLSLFAGCHPLLLNQTYFQLALNQGYTNKETSIMN